MEATLERDLHPFPDDLSLFQTRMSVEHEVGRECPDVARQAPAVKIVNRRHAVDGGDRQG